MYSFINACINSEALLSEIDDYIDLWHESETDLPIYEFLGMTKKEYALFVYDKSYLALIVTAHKDKEDINTIISSQIAMDARSDNHAKSARLEKWLKDEGLWK